MDEPQTLCGLLAKYKLQSFSETFNTCVSSYVDVTCIIVMHKFRSMISLAMCFLIRGISCCTCVTEYRYPSVVKTINTWVNRKGYS